jgi:hypothetical protein
VPSLTLSQELIADGSIRKSFVLWTCVGVLRLSPVPRQKRKACETHYTVSKCIADLLAKGVRHATPGTHPRA